MKELARTTTESQLFDWSGGWDQFGTAGFTFYKVTTKLPFGSLPAGSVFDYVHVDYEYSKIEFGNTTGNSHIFALLTTVGDPL